MTDLYRLEADGHISHALDIVNCAWTDDATQREYTPKELEALFFSLSRAMTLLTKLPGGVEARDRLRARAQKELNSRQPKL
jgi:hypothetical protein